MCPEGTIGLSLGFNPRPGPKNRDRPEGAAELMLQMRICPQRTVDNLFRPFRAGLCMGRVPGVKTPG